MRPRLEILRARSGEPTARFGDMGLHSSFDPRAEAEKFLSTVSPARIYIIIGPCLDYLGQGIKRRGGGERLISIQLSAELRGRELERPAEAWYPDDGPSMESFLLSRLSPAELSGLRVLVWRPAAEAFPAQARAAEEALRSAILQLNGSANAMNRFGARQAVNSCRNALALKTALEPRPSRPGTVLICASGPSLHAALPLLKEGRRRFSICALSSALRPLSQAGIEPDFCVSSDPGWWAGLHLRWLPPSTPLLAPLQACLGQALKTSPLLALDQGGILERRLLAELGLRGLALEAAGTVAATALRACLALGYERVVFAGLDLCAPGIPSHARPQAFDEMLYGGADRLGPAHSRLWEREILSHPLQGPCWRSSPQLDTYAAYFARMASSGLPLFRLGPSLRPLPGLPDLGPQELAALPEREEGRPFIQVKPERAGLGAALRGAASWIAGLAEAERAGRVLDGPSDEALSELLFSSRTALRKARSGAWAERLDEAASRLDADAQRLQKRILAAAESLP